MKLDCSGTSDVCKQAKIRTKQILYSTNPVIICSKKEKDILDEAIRNYRNRRSNRDYKRKTIMGDHRASIKIEMTFHGVTEKMNMWINYWPNECCNMDKRVIEFFEMVYEKGMEKYNALIEKDEEYMKNKAKEAELKELKRLKDKYESKL